jgi:hypothetical protein
VCQDASGAHYSSAAHGTNDHELVEVWAKERLSVVSFEMLGMLAH